MDTSILPQSFDGGTDFWRETITFDLGWLHEDSMDVILGALIVKRKLKALHSLEYNAHRLDGVAVDNFLERFTLVARIRSLVDEFHLLQNGRFTRLASTFTDSK